MDKYASFIAKLNVAIGEWITQPRLGSKIVGPLLSHAPRDFRRRYFRNTTVDGSPSIIVPYVADRALRDATLDNIAAGATFSFGGGLGAATFYQNINTFADRVRVNRAKDQTIFAIRLPVMGNLIYWDFYAYKRDSELPWPTGKTHHVYPVKGSYINLSLRQIMIPNNVQVAERSITVSGTLKQFIEIIVPPEAMVDMFSDDPNRIVKMFPPEAVLPHVHDNLEQPYHTAIYKQSKAA